MLEGPPKPTESAAQMRAREQKRLASAKQAERQPSLFGEDGT